MSEPRPKGPQWWGVTLGILILGLVVVASLNAEPDSTATVYRVFIGERVFDVDLTPTDGQPYVRELLEEKRQP